MRRKKKQSARVAEFCSVSQSELENECMDYLHGIVAGDEYEAACHYEYARESKLLRRAACERDELAKKKWRRKDRRNPTTMEKTDAVWERAAQNLLLKLEGETRGSDAIPSATDWWIQYPFGAIWRCPVFPSKPWNQVSEQDRRDILIGFASSNTESLTMNSVVMLDAMRVFDEFKQRAADAKLARQQGVNSPSLLPVLDMKGGGGRFAHVVFTLDFSESPTRMSQRFKEWFKLPENQARSRKHKPSKGVTDNRNDEATDRLKDLAAWRIQRQLRLNNSCLTHEGVFVEVNCFARTHRRKFQDAAAVRKWAERRKLTKQEKEKLGYNKGCPMPFHGARANNGTPANQTELFATDSQLRAAAAAAKSHLAALMPDEFGETWEEGLRDLDFFKALTRKRSANKR